MSTPAVPILEVHDLTVSYHHKPVLWNIDLQLDEPSLIAILGPNGAGKSTLLKAMLGLLPIVSGRVDFFGQPLSRVRQRVGYVPQRESVDWEFPVNVRDVVVMGTYGRLKWYQRPGKAEYALVDECLDQVGLTSLADRQIGRLSGGQQQRTFLARALAQRADLYFMDEPMAGVDAATEQAIFSLLHILRKEGKTVVVVHHDLRTVETYFDRVILVNTHLIAAGSVEESFTTTNLQKAYGGRLALLDRAGDRLQSERPIR